MRLLQLLLAFAATICFVMAGNAIAQTDINVNNSNLIRFGGSITVPENQTVENAFAFGGNVTISPNARVIDTAIAFGGDVLLQKGSRVEGDAYSFGGKITQEPGTVISGEKSTFSDRHGMMYGSNDVVSRGRTRFFSGYFFSSIFRISAAVVAAVLGLIILQGSPQFLPDLAAKMQQNPSLVALWGIGAMVSTVLFIIFLAITLVGIPLIPLLILTTIITSLVGSLGLALFVGHRLGRSDNQSLQHEFLVGLAVITVLTLIPFLGGLVVFLVNLLGLGLILLWRFGHEKPQIVA